jgi:hypothetical protein
MTLADVAGVTGLGWDTVKEMVRPYLEREAAQLSYRPLQYLAIDEIYVGRKKKFYTLDALSQPLVVGIFC